MNDCYACGEDTDLSGGDCCFVGMVSYPLGSISYVGSGGVIFLSVDKCLSGQYGCNLKRGADSYRYGCGVDVEFIRVTRITVTVTYYACSTAFSVITSGYRHIDTILVSGINISHEGRGGEEDRIRIIVAP